MFIKADSIVRITTDRQRHGCIGRVIGIALHPENFIPWIKVSVFNQDNGRFDELVFFPGELVQVDMCERTQVVFLAFEQENRNVRMEQAA